MAFACEAELRPTHHLLRITGQVDMATIPELQGIFDRLIAAHPRAVVVDLSQLSFIASLGMGSLLNLHKAITSYGGIVRLACPQPMIAVAFERIRLDEVLDIHDSLQSAQAFDAP